jgi:hypothetical protein
MINYMTEANTSDTSKGKDVRDLGVDKESIENPVKLQESGMWRERRFSNAKRMDLATVNSAPQACGLVNGPQVVVLGLRITMVSAGQYFEELRVFLETSHRCTRLAYRES